MAVKKDYLFPDMLPEKVYIVCYTREAQSAMEDCISGAMLLNKAVPHVWEVKPNEVKGLSWNRINHVLRNEPTPDDIYLEWMGYGLSCPARNIYPMKLLKAKPELNKLPAPEAYHR